MRTTTILSTVQGMTRTNRINGGRSGPPVIDIYARISQAREGNTRSVDGQVDDLTDMIAERDGVVGEIFRDPNRSAWNPRVLRPEWNALMDRLESGVSDGVAVYDVTRFSRKIIEGERLVTVADKGLAVWSLYGEYDLTTADGRRHFREDMVTAASESDKISERTSRGKRKKAMRGRSNATHRGFGSPGYLPKPDGWEPGDIRLPVPDDQLARERDAIREAVSRLLAGDTIASAVRYLNREGFTTYAGLQWNASALKATLRRPSMAGIAEYHGEEVGLLPGEPILDRDTWERLQSSLAARRAGRRPSPRYLLTSLLLCGRCGHPLNGRPRNNMRPYPDGEVARQYWCQVREGRGGGCGRISVDQRFADEVVIDATLARLGDPRHADRLAKQAAKVAATREKITTEITRLTDEGVAIAGKAINWGTARVDAAMAPIDRRLAELRAELASLDESPETPLSAASDVAQAWELADIDNRRLMIRRAFPDKITVMPATSGRDVTRFLF
jgi:site-specific DNA recombinase